MILEGDCVEVMAGLEPNSVDSIVCDPPYGLEFMGRSWDSLRNGREVDPAFAHWLAGFIDGEGCFSVHKKRPNKGKRETYDCQFSITVRADDRPVLDRIQRTLGIGTVAVRDRGPNAGNAKPTARYCVSAQAECLILRDVLRMAPLRAKKARDFEIWSDALAAWLEHEPGQGWDEVAKHRDALMTGRAFEAEGVRISPEQIWHWRWAREAYRVLKPGGHLLAFGGTRTYHRLTCAIEDAGFEIRDCLAWLYGSGFPKSLDVSKAIDKAAGVEREVVGSYAVTRDLARNGRTGDEAISPVPVEGTTVSITAPATPEAEQWQGWGTALKPAHEPIVLARKPLTGTVAGNVLAHGTGALNIDGTRIGASGGTRKGSFPNEPSVSAYGDGLNGACEIEDIGAGRWPANVILDPEAGAMLDEQSGERQAGAHPKRRGAGTAGYHGWPNGTESDERIELEAGGASRYFYCAKASRGERNAGLDGFEERMPDNAIDRAAQREGLEGAGGRGSLSQPRANVHPTVKPIALMRWLCRLVTPQGGRVLDPFAGSGTTGAAAVLEGFDFVGIEREAEYAEIARARIAFWSGYEGADTEAVLAVEARRDHDQASLFDEVA